MKEIKEEELSRYLLFVCGHLSQNFLGPIRVKETAVTQPGELFGGLFARNLVRLDLLDHLQNQIERYDAVSAHRVNLKNALFGEFLLIPVNAQGKINGMGREAYLGTDSFRLSK